MTSAAFDPARKTSKGTATDAKGQAVKIVKGAVATFVALAAADAEACEAADKLENKVSGFWRWPSDLQPRCD